MSIDWKMKVTDLVKDWSYPDFLINRPCQTENCYGFR